MYFNRLSNQFSWKEAVVVASNYRKVLVKLESVYDTTPTFTDGPHFLSPFRCFRPESPVPARSIPSRSEANVSPGKLHRFTNT